MIDTVTRFIGRNLSQNSKIADQCKFESMSTNKATNYSEYGDHRIKSKPPFVRKGLVGNWRNHFTMEQNVEFNTVYADKMKFKREDF